MKVLIVAVDKGGHFVPFVEEQMHALQAKGCVVERFGVKGKGVLGYLKCMPALHRKIKQFAPDVIHAHYGFSGLLSNLQFKIPVVTTYHGSDINNPQALRFSKMSMALSDFNVFVSQKTMDIAGVKRKCGLIPCGVDVASFVAVDKEKAKEELHFSQLRKYVLFAGAFDVPVKNAPLAQQAIALLDNVSLVELKGYTRKEVLLLMQAVDAFLMTSHTEGSPQVVKEAMLCGCPIVSVDVGDVSERIAGVEGCYIAERTPQDLAEKLTKAMNFEGRTNGRDKLLSEGFDNAQIAEQLLDVYRKVTKKNI